MLNFGSNLAQLQCGTTPQQLSQCVVKNTNDISKYLVTI